MSAPSGVEHERALARRAAQALAPYRGAWPGVAGMLFAAAYGVHLADGRPLAMASLTAALIIGALAVYALGRVSYDARVFAALVDAADLAGAVAEFDRRWQRGKDGRSRPMADRVAGAQRWTRRCALAMALQFALTTAGFWPLRHLLD